MREVFALDSGSSAIWVGINRSAGGGLLLPVRATAHIPRTVVWRLILLWSLLVAPTFQGFQTDAYVVGEESGPQLQGCSGIRY